MKMKKSWKPIDNVLEYKKPDFSPSRKRNKCYHIKSSFALLFKGFLFHFCCYKIKLSSMKWTLMLTLSATCDVFLCILMIKPWFYLKGWNDENVKVYSFGSFLLFSSLNFRFLLYKRGMTLKRIVHLMSRIYSISRSRRVLGIKKLMFCFFVANISYTFLLGIIVSYFSILTTANGTSFYLNMFFLKIESETLRKVTVYILRILTDWVTSSVVVLFSVYFYFVCYVLREAIKSCERLIKGANRMALLDALIEEDIFNMVTKITKMLHSPLVMLSLHILANSFFCLYETLFDPAEDIKALYPALYSLIGNFSCFILVCFSAASVEKAYKSLKHACQCMLLQNYDENNITLVFLLCNRKIVGFILLDSIVVDKALAAEALGTLLTCGIIIATMWNSSA